jgi:hypothetical protein
MGTVGEDLGLVLTMLDPGPHIAILGTFPSY